MRKSVLAAALVALALPAAADPLMDGGRSYEQGDYAHALAAWQPLAATGNAEAQNNLALLYLDGKGVPRNLPEAVRYFQLSAAAGSALGQNNLGGLYRDGNGLTRDYGKAARWFAAAASQGNSAGMYNLG
jgi:TPR repeat protein